MAADSDESSRVVVQTYLPEYQREEWDAHADELDMSRSEFVKAMVQAGRRGFEGGNQPNPTTVPVEGASEPSDGLSEGDDTSGTLTETVLDALEEGEYRSWDDLLAAVSDDIESRLEETLQNLQAEDRVRYSGRHGGYTLDA